MASKTVEGLKADLEQWRARLDRLRVQADLGKKDARDKLRAFEDRLEPAFDKAKQQIDDVASSGAAEARVIARSLRAGWKEVQKTHSELTRAAKRPAPTTKTKKRP